MSAATGQGPEQGRQAHASEQRGGTAPELGTSTSWPPVWQREVAEHPKAGVQDRELFPTPSR